MIDEEVNRYEQQIIMSLHSSCYVQPLEFDFAFTDEMHAIKSVFLHRKSVLCQQIVYLKIWLRQRYGSMGNDRTDADWGNIYVDFGRAIGSWKIHPSLKGGRVAVDRVRNKAHRLAQKIMDMGTTVDIRDVNIIPRNGNDILVVLVKPPTLDNEIIVTEKGDGMEFFILIDVIQWDYYPQKSVRNNDIYISLLTVVSSMGTEEECANHNNKTAIIFMDPRKLKRNKKGKSCTKEDEEGVGVGNNQVLVLPPLPHHRFCSRDIAMVGQKKKK